MQLVALTIRNFRVIKETHIRFSDKVVGVIGPNGAGKSSFIEAIAWALYGNQSARSGRDEIQAIYARANDWCEVSLSFLIHEQPYRVVRRLHGLSGKGEVKLYRGDSTESLGIRETDKFIRDLLGLDWKGFSTSFLARQQELSALSDIPTALRRDHLAGMLGIERLDKAIKRVKEDGKLTSERVSFFERQLTGLEGYTIRLQEITKRIDDCRRALPELEQARNSADLTLKQCTEEFSQMQKLQTEVLVKRGELDAWRRTFQEVSEQIERLRVELADLEKMRQQVVSLEQEVAQLPQLQQKERLLQQAELYSANYQTKRKREEELQRQIQEAEQKQISHLRRTQEIEQELGALPADAETKEAQLAQQLETARQKYSETQASITAMKTAHQKTESQLANIQSLGKDAVCDRCLRPMGEDFAGIINHLTQERQELERQLTVLETVLVEKRNLGTQLRAEKEQLEQATRKRYQLLPEQQTLRQSLIELDTFLTATQKQLVEISKEIKDMVIPSEVGEGDAIRAAIAQLQTKAEQLQQAKGKLERQQTVTNDVNQLQEKAKAASERCVELERELETSKFIEEQLIQKRQQFDTLQKRQEETRTAHELAVRELDVAQAEQRSVTEAISELTKVNDKLELEREALFYGKKLDLLFTAFRNQLISNIRPALAELSSQLMSEMTDGRYSRVELDADYNLQVMDYGRTYGIDRFSGGEKDLANLCLRLAISLALTESAGLNRSFIILDEVFGSQDDGRKELILRAMGNLKQRFPQIILVTHIEDIKGKVEQTIEVSPTGYGWSEVRQIGAA